MKSIALILISLFMACAAQAGSIRCTNTSGLVFTSDLYEDAVTNNMWLERSAGVKEPLHYPESTEVALDLSEGVFVWLISNSNGANSEDFRISTTATGHTTFQGAEFVGTMTTNNLKPETVTCYVNRPIEKPE